MSLSIVIPCYNEEHTIETLIRTLYGEIVPKIDTVECLIVNDCSTDQTPHILSRLVTELPGLKVIQTPMNLGHGGSLLRGYEAASKDYIFQIDSDNVFIPEEFWKMYSLRETYDFIFGFRQKRRDSWYRILISRSIPWINFILFGVWLKDASCPFRLMKREPLKRCLPHIDPETVAPNILMAIWAKKKGYRISEVPIPKLSRKTGQSTWSPRRLLQGVFKGSYQLIQWRLKFP